jgi:hypothetical protein
VAWASYHGLGFAVVVEDVPGDHHTPPYWEVHIRADSVTVEDPAEFYSHCLDDDIGDLELDADGEAVPPADEDAPVRAAIAAWRDRILERVAMEAMDE